MEENIADYPAMGVDLVWVADPYTRTVEVFPRGANPTIIHDGAEIDGAEVLPGFRTPIARFFEDP